MDRTITKARHKAFMEYAESIDKYERFHTKTDEPPPSPFDAGFDAALSLLQWRDVADDLPEVRGMYNVRIRKIQAKPDVCLFTPDNEAMANFWNENILSYIPYPIPPYDKEQR